MSRILARIIAWAMNAAHRVMPYCPPPTLCLTLLLMPMARTPSGITTGG
jgi:hypothetical protein